MLAIELAGTQVRLLAQCAAYPPAQQTLLIADAHIGKAVFLRRVGVPVPSGTTRAAAPAVFHFGSAVGVLPAFGAFTGMHVMPRGDGDRVFVIAGDAVRALNFAP